MVFGLSLLDFLLLLYAAVVVGMMVASLLLFMGFPRLPKVASLAETPRVSVILPVRNQAGTVERCVASLLDSDYPAFEVIAVEGDSEDETRRRLEEFEPQIQIVDEPPLPEGWVGKNWACAQGADVAQGELLLFTDGDTVHQPDLLRRAVAYLQAEQLDLFTIHSRLGLETFWEKVLQPLMIFVIGLVTRGTWINRPDKRWAVANGQYLLFRREAYEALGGHEAVANRVDEDYRLAQRVKQQGRAFRMLDSTGALEVRMYTSLEEIWKGWTKGMYPGMDFSLFRVVRGAVGLVLLLVLPFVMLGWALLLLPATGPSLLLLVSGALVLLILARLAVAHWFLGGHPAYALFTAVGALFIAGMALDSARRYRRHGGVAWKGRVYGIPGKP